MITCATGVLAEMKDMKIIMFPVSTIRGASSSWNFQKKSPINIPGRLSSEFSVIWNAARLRRMDNEPSIRPTLVRIKGKHGTHTEGYLSMEFALSLLLFVFFGGNNFRTPPYLIMHSQTILSNLTATRLESCEQHYQVRGRKKTLPLFEVELNLSSVYPRFLLFH